MIQSIPKDVNYIVWTEGSDGTRSWTPTYCKTLEECIDVESYGQNKIITKKCNISLRELD